MSHAQCPMCGYRVGLGSWSEPGECPACGEPLVLTCEFRAVAPATATGGQPEQGPVLTSAPAPSSVR